MVTNRDIVNLAMRQARVTVLGVRGDLTVPAAPVRGRQGRSGNITGWLVPKTLRLDPSRRP